MFYCIYILKKLFTSVEAFGQPVAVVDSNRLYCKHVHICLGPFLYFRRYLHKFQPCDKRILNDQIISYTKSISVIGYQKEITLKLATNLLENTEKHLSHKKKVASNILLGNCILKSGIYEYQYTYTTSPEKKYLKD